MYPDPMTDPSPDEPMPEHPPAELMAAYLSGALSPQETVAFEAHVAGCRTCRTEVTTARRILRSTPSGGRWLPLTAAAAILFIALLVNSYGRRGAPDRLRTGGDGEADTVPRLPVIAPADGDTVSPDRLRLVWGGHTGGPLFHVTVTDASGRAVWLRETPDTAVTLPADIELSSGRTYYWYVDALDATGSSLTTGTHRFFVVP
jgi:putative zinc finger protein